MPDDGVERLWPQHEVTEILVEREKFAGSQQEGDQPHLPVRHAGLQNYRGEMYAPAAKMPTEERQIFAHAARDWVGNPVHPRQWKFGNDYQGKLGKKLPYFLDSGRNQILRSGRKQDLDCLAHCHLKSKCDKGLRTRGFRDRPTRQAPARKTRWRQDSRTAKIRRVCARSRIRPRRLDPLRTFEKRPSLEPRGSQPLDPAGFRPRLPRTAVIAVAARKHQT